MAPVLNKRQRRAYRDRCTLFRPAPESPGLEMSDLSYQTAPAYATVPCLYLATPETDQPTLEGRTKQVNIFTLDYFHFAAAQEIADGWVIRLDTAGHPLRGYTWIVQGNPQVWAGRANYAQVYAKVGPAPPGIPTS